MVSVTINYRQPGTQPPIFVAGSFSDPQWEPQEMQFTTDESGEHTFYKNIDVPPSSQLQYKFRVGLGDWWVLNEDATTVTDSSGNRNNLLTAPESQEHAQLNGVKDDQNASGDATAASIPTSNMDTPNAADTHSTTQPEPKSKLLGNMKDEERQRLSSTPIEQVAATAAEVANTAQKLDGEDITSRPAPLSKGVDHLKDGERKRLSSTPIEQVASTAAEVADTAQELDREDITSQPAPLSKGVNHLKDEERKRLSSTPIEQVASTAAEVADVAQKLDAEDVTRLAPPAKGIDHLKDEERKRLSSTPIEQVASTAAEVADTAQKLDADQDLEELDETNDGPAPLFAHEALGPYDLSAIDDEDEALREAGHHGTVEYDVDKYDLNDPSLERWPSNRDGIIDAVRKVETGRNEDQTSFHGAPLSPVIGSRKTSLDPYFDETVLSGPSSPSSAKRLELPRKSHGSMVSDRSLLSLGSIAEEDKETPNADEANRENEGLIRVPSPAVRPTPNVFTSPASDEDEGVVMKGSKSKAKKSSEPERARSSEINGEANGKYSRDPSPKTRPAQSDSPSIRVQSPGEEAESSSAQDGEQATAVAPISGGEASATGRDGGHNGQLKKRGASSTERPGTPSSIQSVANSKGGWVQAFFRVLFVDWIGGLFTRLFGSKRKVMLATSTAAIVIGVAWWKFAMGGDLSWLQTWV